MLVLWQIADKMIGTGGEFRLLPSLKKCRISCGMIRQPIASPSLQQLTIQCRDMLPDKWPVQFGKLPHLRLLRIECGREFITLSPDTEWSSYNYMVDGHKFHNTSFDLERTRWNCKVIFLLISHLMRFPILKRIEKWDSQSCKQTLRVPKW